MSTTGGLRSLPTACRCGAGSSSPWTPRWYLPCPARGSPAAGVVVFKAPPLPLHAAAKSGHTRSCSARSAAAWLSWPSRSGAGGVTRQPPLCAPSREPRRERCRFVSGPLRTAGGPRGTNGLCASRARRLPLSRVFGGTNQGGGEKARGEKKKGGHRSGKVPVEAMDGASVDAVAFSLGTNKVRLPLLSETGAMSPIFGSAVTPPVWVPTARSAVDDEAAHVQKVSQRPRGSWTVKTSLCSWPLVEEAKLAKTVARRRSGQW